MHKFVASIAVVSLLLVGRTVARGADEPRVLAGHESSVMTVTFSPRGRTLATSSRDGKIHFWDPATGKLLRTIADAEGDVYVVTFSPDGTQLAGGGRDTIIRLYDSATGKLLRTFEGHQDIVRGLAFSPDGKKLLSLSVDTTGRIWDATTGELLHTLIGHTARGKSAVYSNDGKWVATAASDRTIRIWDPATGKELRKIDAHTSDIETIALSPDGKLLASSSNDTTVRLWDTTTWEAVRVLEGHTAEVDAVEFAPDGRTVASGGKDTLVNLWDVATGKLLRTLRGHTGRVESLTFSPDGKLLVTGGGGGDSSVRIWTLVDDAPGDDAPKSGAAPVRFRKQTLTDKYYCDGIHTGDFNRDGRADIVAGPFWYEGPEFTVKHEFYPAHEFPTKPAPTDSMFSYVYDFNGDAWPDILVLGRVHLHSAYWYENPRGAEGPWPKHFAFERVQGESPPFTDVDGDGRPELVAHWEGRWGLIQPAWREPTEPWRFRPITEQGAWQPFHHGTGIGDVNADGRLDLILNQGWWEQPADPNVPWTKHEYTFSHDRGGAQMFAVDVNGDKLPDVVSALNAHGYGLAWFKQLPDDARATFLEQKMMGTRDDESAFGVCFSQPHALAVADLDGDGLTDVIAGKRMWAHPPPKDIEPDAPPVLYWFRCVRDCYGNAMFVPYEIDDRSGVGVQVTVADVTGDGRLDILTVSKLGTFVFRSGAK